jgi:hypothetical protein
MHTENFTYKERVWRVSLTEIRVFFNLKWSKAASRALSYPENSLKFPISPTNLQVWNVLRINDYGEKEAVAQPC